MANAELNAEPESVSARRIEVITGPVRRRGWSSEDKERIIAESYAGLDTVCGIARRNGLSPQQLFTWRREAKKRGAIQPAEAMSFAPVVVAAPRPTAENHEKGKPRRRPTRRSGAESVPIVIEAGAILVRIGQGADTKAVETILRTLKGMT